MYFVSYKGTVVDFVLLKENTHLNKNESKIEDITETVRLPQIS